MELLGQILIGTVILWLPLIIVSGIMNKKNPKLVKKPLGAFILLFVWLAPYVTWKIFFAPVGFGE